MFSVFQSLPGKIVIQFDEMYDCMLCPMADYWEFNISRLKPDASGSEEQIISDILHGYQSYNLQSLGWIVGPNSCTPGISNILQKAGFQYRETFKGMVRDLSPIQRDDTIEIQPMPTNYLHSHEAQEMVEVAYGMPKGTGKLVYHLSQSMEQNHFQLFIAFDNEKPIGFSNFVQIPDTTYALFNGAATLPEYRNRGVYTAMLSKRVNYGVEKGITNILIQAKESSAMVARQHGFEYHSDIKAWVRE